MVKVLLRINELKSSDEKLLYFIIVIFVQVSYSTKGAA